MEALTEEQIAEIRGRNSTNTATQGDIENLLTYIEFLEDKLNEADEEDTFGTEGWRHYFGLED